MTVPLRGARPLVLAQLLATMIEHGASDLHMQVGSPPMFRIHGRVRFADSPPLTAEVINEAADQIMTGPALRILEQEGSADLSFTFGDDARFRVNIFAQQGTYGLAFRHVSLQIPSILELNLPDVLIDVASIERGLVLVSGTTSSGKSTTIAAMVGHINRSRSCRIITVEDPIEFVHRSDRALVAQIEVGTDTRSYEDAIRHILRQDPDVVMVGELRDAESIRVALRAADTGHLVFATVHATNAQQTIERVIAMFDATQHHLLLTQLGMNIEAVVSLRLARRRDAEGRLPVVEVMRGTPVVRKLILEGRHTVLSQAIANRDGGMQTFDQHLGELYRSRAISAPEALRLATNAEALAMGLRGISTRDMGTGLVR